MSQGSVQYTPDIKRMFLGGTIAPAIGEFVSDAFPEVHRVLPSAIDVFVHSGNMTFGGSAAMATLVGYAARQAHDRHTLDVVPEKVTGLHRYSLAAVAMGATALINATTETRWGIAALPIADFLTVKGEPIPDLQDALWSTAWAGVTATFFGWKKKIPAPTANC